MPQNTTLYIFFLPAGVLGPQERAQGLRGTQEMQGSLESAQSSAEAPARNESEAPATPSCPHASRQHEVAGGP